MFLFVVCQLIFVGSSIFQVHDVSIKTEEGLPESVIRQAMDLGPKPRYWDMSAANLEAGIQELDGVESAKVDVGFPGSLSVMVTERKPLYTVSSAATTSHPFTADKAGIVLGPGHAPTGALSVIVARPVKKGGRLSPRELRVLDRLQAHLTPELQAKLDTVSFDSHGDLLLRLKHKQGLLPVRLGRPEKLSYKLFVLEELLDSLKREGSEVVSIDLRFTTPIVRGPFVASPVGEPG